MINIETKASKSDIGCANFFESPTAVSNFEFAGKTSICPLSPAHFLCSIANYSKGNIYCKDGILKEVTFRSDYF